jgi:hypothetical protein
MERAGENHLSPIGDNKGLSPGDIIPDLQCVQLVWCPGNLLGFIQEFERGLEPHFETDRVILPVIKSIIFLFTSMIYPTTSLQYLHFSHQPQKTLSF